MCVHPLMGPCNPCAHKRTTLLLLQPVIGVIHRFGQRLCHVWQNEELTSKGEDVKLITRWKHVPDTGLFSRIRTVHGTWHDCRSANVVDSDFQELLIN